MGLGKYRNEPCPCKSGKKFKQCCLTKHNQAQVQLETPLAKLLTEKEVGYWKQRYDRMTKTNV
jgi:hypothetical protein